MRSTQEKLAEAMDVIGRHRDKEVSLTIPADDILTVWSALQVAVTAGMFPPHVIAKLDVIYPRMMAALPDELREHILSGVKEERREQAERN